MKLRVVLLVPMLALLMTACAGRMTRPDALPPLAGAAAIAAADADQARRVAWLEAHPQWTLDGRIAISNAGKGGSGRIDWQQAGDTYVVSLSAPVTRQSWRMSGGPDGALLEGVQGGAREGSDPAQLLLEATGWQIPVEALADWARGKVSTHMPRDAATGPATLAEVAYAQDGRLQWLQQDGWRIEYLQWQAPVGDRPALPARIDAQRGEAKVRLIIDNWAFSAQ